MAMSLSVRCLEERSHHLRLRNLNPLKLETSLPLSLRDLMLAPPQTQNHLHPEKKIVAMLKTKDKNLDKNLDPDSWWQPSLLTKRLIAMLKWRSLLRFLIPEILPLLKKGLNQRCQELLKLHKQLKQEIKKDKMMKH